MNYLDKTGLTRFWSKIITKLDQKQDKLYKLSWKHLISSVMATQADGYVKNALVDLSVGYLESSDIQSIINLATSEKKVLLNSREYIMEKMTFEDEDEERTGYALTYNIEMIEDEQEAAQYELGIERVDSSKPCFFLILSPNQEMPNGYLVILGSNQTIVNTIWKLALEEDIDYISNVAITGNYNDLKNIPTDIERKIPYILNNQTYYYQFYGVSSIAGIVVNVGVEIDVVYATLVLIMQSIEEMKQGYSNTLAAIQGMHIPDDVYEQPVLIVAIHNLGTMTCYIDESTRYVTRAIFTNFAQGYSVDFGTNPTELTIYYSALNSDDYLSKTNTDTYTPASDYNPATKKYVDDAIADALRNAGIIN